jgi:hypothetical protein
VKVVRFSFLDVDVTVRCADEALRRLLAESYRGRARGRARGSLEYGIVVGAGRSGLRLARRGARPRQARDVGELLLLFDSDLNVQLQRLRRDLYFVHSAVLVRGGRAALLVGGSGAGKSTAAWALAHHGFGYAGDELAPIDAARLSVHPCPRALCLKSRPPAGYPLPPDARRTSRGWHIATGRLLRAPRAPLELGAVFFVSHAEAPAPGRTSWRLGPAEAAARLYAHALNPLAHPGRGLDAAIQVARGVPAYRLESRRLAEASRRVAAILDGGD